MTPWSSPRPVLHLLCATAFVACERPSEPEISIPEPSAELVDVGGVQDGNPGNPFLGAWRLASAIAEGGEDLKGPGLSWVVIFRSDGTFSSSVSDDSGHVLCPGPEISCAWDGGYSYTATTVTLTEDGGPEPGDDTSLYLFCGGGLTLMSGGEDGSGVRLSFVRTRQDCYVRGCD